MREYDAIVVGGGHNGLVAGFYLARAGLRTVILERRDIVGGACVTEEFAPGFRASTGAYVLSMLRESIWRDMRLVQRGIQVDAAGPDAQRVPRRRPLHRRRRYGPDARGDPALLAARRRRPRAVRRGPRTVRRRRDPVLRADGARPARPQRARSARAGARRTDRAPAPPGPVGPGVPVHDVRDAVPVGAVRVRARDGRARVARDQRQRRRARPRRGPRSCCCTTTRARRPAAGRARGGSSAAGWAG